jgi:hypothetical protein
MKVVKNKVVFFISFLLDCVTTHTACQVVPIPRMEFDEGPEEVNVYFQVRYLLSKGESQLTQFLLFVIPVLGHPARLGGGMGPHGEQTQIFLRAVPGVSQSAPSGSLV